MKLKDQMPSDNVEDAYNPPGWMARLKAALTPDQKYKVDPEIATSGNKIQRSEKTGKSSRLDEYVNREGKGGYKQPKGNRYRPPSKTGGGGGY